MEKWGSAKLMALLIYKRFFLGLKFATTVNGINQNNSRPGPTDVKALMAEDISFAEFRKGSRSEPVHHLQEKLPKHPTCCIHHHDVCAHGPANCH